MPDSPFAAAPSLYLGIDTGGTYTDAVLWSEARGIVAKAKALTTRYDLAVGIAGAVDAAVAAGAIRPDEIALVSMSTTLATNALVEGQGERAALVMIGFGEADLARSGLKAALGHDPVVFLPGGHDVFGAEAPLVLDPLEAALPALRDSVSAFAVCGHFAVRNPAHEIAVRDLIRERTGLPVTTSHELTAKLGGPKRALTTLLNARLISMIERLVTATEGFLAARRIAAPLMVVRGDGALVTAAFAKARPIETILSGPAASLVGARRLAGLEDAVVADIGGTTTDAGVLDRGRPRLDPEGASVGGFRTMVEAVAMRTFGLGGDSEVHLEHSGLGRRLRLGPRRLAPLSLAATLHGEAILKPLEKQARAARPGEWDGRFAFRTGAPDRLAAGLSAADAALYAELGLVPAPLGDLMTMAVRKSGLARLVARGLVQVAGFTPSDAAHVLGRQSNWNGAAALLGAELFSRRKDGRGEPAAASARDLADQVLAEVTRASAEAILETAFAEDGLDGAATVAHGLAQRAIDGRGGIARLTVSLDRPVVGLGASASLHYSGLAALVGNRCLTPEDADVANALGAVVGQVRVHAEAYVSQPVEGLFRVSAGETLRDFSDEREAVATAENAVREAVRLRAAAAGTDNAEISVASEIKAPEIAGRRTFVEVRVVATAAGRPRIAGERGQG